MLYAQHTPGLPPQSLFVQQGILTYRLNRDLSQRFKESMLRLGGEDDAERQTRELSPVDSEFTNSRIGEWLGDLDGVPAVEGPNPFPSDADAQEQLVSLPDGEDDDDNEIILPDKYGYRQAVFGSTPYNALVARLTREALLAPCPLEEGEGMSNIRTQILAAIPDRRSVSRRSDSQIFKIAIDANWNPIQFLGNQYGGFSDPQDLLGKVITLTGSMSDA
jgi:hypothetical protein